jgi:hypothetical protein
MPMRGVAREPSNYSYFFIELLVRVLYRLTIKKNKGKLKSLVNNENCGIWYLL